jgi:hypothetical protein
VQALAVPIAVEHLAKALGDRLAQEFDGLRLVAQLRCDAGPLVDG